MFACNVHFDLPQVSWTSEMSNIIEKGTSLWDAKTNDIGKHASMMC